MAYTVTYERDEAGWWIARVQGVAGVNSDGRTVDDARRRVREALSLAIGDEAAEAAELVEEVRRGEQSMSTESPNATTRAAMEELKSGKKLQRFATVDELMADLKQSGARGKRGAPVKKSPGKARAEAEQPATARRPGSRGPLPKGLEGVMIRMEPWQAAALRRIANGRAAEALKRGAARIVRADYSAIVREAVAAWLVENDAESSGRQPPGSHGRVKAMFSLEPRQLAALRLEAHRRAERDPDVKAGRKTLRAAVDASAIVREAVDEWLARHGTSIPQGELTIHLERENDGRWLAGVEALPGVLAYGATEDEAVARVQAQALHVIADRLEDDDAERAPMYRLEDEARRYMRAAAVAAGELNTLRVALGVLLGSATTAALDPWMDCDVEAAAAEALAWDAVRLARARRWYVVPPDEEPLPAAHPLPARA